VLSIYKVTRDFPKEELYGLTAQLRLASVSIPANIAEEYKKRRKQDKLRFLNIAHGSLEESYYYLILSHDFGYAITNEQINLKEEVGKLLNAYSKAILISPMGFPLCGDIS
ncbi:MAG: four helix bundle protein, partial [Bacteroidota bacterium]